MGMLGAMAGLGAGVSDVADRRIKAFGEQQMMAIKDQIDQAREARILEAQRGNMAIENQYKIESEKRGLENDKTKAQNAIDINTDPNNISKLTAAEVAKLKAKDEYGDSRFDTELDQATRKARALDEATYHDNTDYEGRRLSHELDRMKLDEAKQPQFKMTKADEKRYDFLKEQYQSLAKARGEAMDEKAKVSIMDDMDKINAQVDQLLSKYDGESKAQTKVAVDDDPLGVKRDLLLKDLRKINPKVDVSEKLSNSDLQGIIDYELKNKGAGEAEKPKGMLESAAKKPVGDGGEAAMKAHLMKVAEPLYPNMDLSGMTVEQLIAAINKKKQDQGASQEEEIAQSPNRKPPVSKFFQQRGGDM